MHYRITSDMIWKNISRSVKHVPVYLLGISALLWFAAVGYADAFQHHDGSGGRRSQRYDGHRGGGGGGEYRSRPPIGDRSYLRGPERGNRPTYDRGDRHYRGPDGRRQGTVYRRGEVFRHGRSYPGYGRRPKPYPERHDYGPRYHHDRRRFYGRPVWRPGWGYRPGFAPGGVWVRPRIGAMFVTLPLGSAAVTIGGARYFYYDDVYYRPVPSGYIVVSPPVAAIPQIVSGDVAYTQATVTAALLNVRSGPGAGYAPFRQVRKGELLDVSEQSDGWLFVTLPDGEKGWIDIRYVAPVIDVGG